MNEKNSIREVLIPGSSPLISFRILFNVGAASDPAGKEGVASLTAAMLAAGGSRNMTYEEIVRAMYPMATSFLSQVDKEMTVFTGSTHIDNLADYYRIISEMLLAPGWREEDFSRLREDAINFLKVNLRGTNDEELGKEELYNFIYRNHAYGHNNAGTIQSLEKLKIDDVREFYSQHYSQANLVIGIAGGFPREFAEQVKADFASTLPAGEAAFIELPEPEKIEGLRMRIIEKETRGDAISFGFPIAINRSHKDWPALFIAQSHLGQHRSSNSLLYQRLRQVRGLNYGDYAYIEYFPNGMFFFHPEPNLARRQQIFQVWIRPVESNNSLFALRAAFYELRKLVEKGLTEEEFEGTRRFLSKFVNVLTKTQNTGLGYALDSDYYRIPGFTDYIRESLSKLTLDEVNRVIKNYLQADNVKIIVVTGEAAAFREAAVAGKPSPITYASPPPADVLEEDKLIEIYPLNLSADSIEIVPVEEVFKGKVVSGQ
jgi:zinc protease